MYRGFLLEADSNRFLSSYKAGKTDYNRQKERLKATLHRFLGPEGVIDGSPM
jgi:hypothetical protein